MYESLKKKYGQNFLIDKNILNKISKLITGSNLNIYEIGPGDGRLTEFILKFKPNKLTIIEKDADLIPTLIKKFSEYEEVNIINEDILKFHLTEKIDLIISNLPFNISSQILVKICLLKNLPEELILMFQKEFAQRLLDKKLNSLNSLVNCFYNINHNFDVSKYCFRPVPKVDSKVLFFTKRKNILLNKNEIQKYVEFKRNLFSYKRKSLKNSLKKYNLIKNTFDLTQRVEDLSLGELLKIFRLINL
jgi:16S rRNA (adenine1518-N6/adenine1519-N6)-dimethyltransferase